MGGAFGERGILGRSGKSSDDQGVVIREVNRVVGGGHRRDVAIEIGPVNPSGPRGALDGIVMGHCFAFWVKDFIGVFQFKRIYKLFKTFRHFWFRIFGAVSLIYN